MQVVSVFLCYTMQITVQDKLFSYYSAGSQSCNRMYEMFCWL